MQLWSVFAATLLAVPASTRVVWLPEQFHPNDKGTVLAASLTARAEDCSNASCGPAFPSDFTCPPTTQCLSLKNTASVKAVFCCPAGQDCRIVQTVSCDQTRPNATLYQGSSLHSEPTTQLNACGSDCCPMGYACQSGRCAAQSAPIPAASVAASTSSSSVPSPSSTTTPSPIGTPTNSSTPAPTHAAEVAVGGLESGSHPKFSGSSFAAGFIPGIFLGALATCLLFWMLWRKPRSGESYVNEKQSPRDTLTDLTTLSRRPTMHGRSISEPMPDPTAGHRTEFLRTTPPRAPDSTGFNFGYSVEVHAPGSEPRTPARTPKAVKALFSRSPFMNQTPATPPSTQPPLPAHLKRGTLSFAVSPVRALKKQKSMHSLRRQMTDASHGSNRRVRPDISRSGSQETIQVLMPSNDPYTPDQRPQPKGEAPATLQSGVYQPPTSATSWQTTDSDDVAMPQPAAAQYASSSRYSTQTSTPTKWRVTNGDVDSGNEGTLGTPFTPSRYYGNGGRVKDVLIGNDGGLRVVREPEKRDTTFSAMMERAGFRKSDLMTGTGQSAQVPINGSGKPQILKKHW